MDNSIFEPASSFIANKYNPTEHYSITSLDLSNPSKPLAVLSPTSTFVIPKPGQLVSFLNGTCTFYIDSISSGVKAVYVSGDTAQLKEKDLGTIQNIYKPQDIRYKIINKTAKLGALKVKVNTPVHHKDGYLGWTLYLYDSVLLVGNDLNSKGYIEFYGSSVWEPGLYRIVVSAYDQYTKGLLNIADKEIEITAPAASFDIGTPYSLHKPIDL
jgi:hypothetical protein